MRIGPKMREAVEYVAANPGCTQHEASVAVGPNGSNAYGYAILKRCYAAGLITREWRNGQYGTYSLTVTDGAR